MQSAALSILLCCPAYMAQVSYWTPDTLHHCGVCMPAHSRQICPRNVRLMLCQRRRRWHSINLTFGGCLLAEWCYNGKHVTWNPGYPHLLRPGASDSPDMIIFNYFKNAGIEVSSLSLIFISRPGNKLFQENCVWVNGWVNVGPASKPVEQHWTSIG